MRVLYPFPLDVITVLSLKKGKKGKIYFKT